MYIRVKLEPIIIPSSMMVVCRIFVAEAHFITDAIVVVTEDVVDLRESPSL